MHAPLTDVWRDWRLALAFLAAPLFWLALFWIDAPAMDWRWPLRDPSRFLLLALVSPVIEEIVFRGGAQGLFLRQRVFANRWHGISGANVMTSIAFSALHLITHPAPWAIAVFIPSLVFGYFRDRYHNLALPIALHVFYNAGYFWFFPPAP